MVFARRLLYRTPHDEVVVDSDDDAGPEILKKGPTGKARDANGVLDDKAFEEQLLNQIIEKVYREYEDDTLRDEIEHFSKLNDQLRKERWKKSY